MDKKDLKFYVAPSQEVVELNAQFALLAASEKPGDGGIGGGTGFSDDDED